MSEDVAISDEAEPSPSMTTKRMIAALEFFAGLADACDILRHEDDSTCEWRIRASDLRAARALRDKLKSGDGIRSAKA